MMKPIKLFSSFYLVYFLSEINYSFIPGRHVTQEQLIVTMYLILYLTTENDPV